MTAPIPFEKLHGTGNDFVVIDARYLPDNLNAVRAICDRHRGIGADGVLVVSDIAHDASSARMVIYNQDTTRPEMCGNGVRCVARWLVERHGFSTDLTVHSDAGPRACRVDVDKNPWTVRVDMGHALVGDEISIHAAGHIWHGVPVDMGNPHFVVFEPTMPSLELIDSAGRELNSAHSDFPAGVNLEVCVKHDTEVEVVVFERGVGRTQACGTGACAVAAAGHHAALLDAQVPVRLPGGLLTIETVLDRVWMTGDAESVFRGELETDWINARLKHSPGGV